MEKSILACLFMFAHLTSLCKYLRKLIVSFLYSNMTPDNTLTSPFMMFLLSTPIKRSCFVSKRKKRKPSVSCNAFTKRTRPATLILFIFYSLL